METISFIQVFVWTVLYDLIFHSRAPYREVTYTGNKNLKLMLKLLKLVIRYLKPLTRYLKQLTNHLKASAWCAL